MTGTQVLEKEQNGQQRQSHQHRDPEEWQPEVDRPEDPPASGPRRMPMPSRFVEGDGLFRAATGDRDDRGQRGGDEQRVAETPARAADQTRPPMRRSRPGWRR